MRNFQMEIFQLNSERTQRMDQRKRNSKNQAVVGSTRAKDEENVEINDFVLLCLTKFLYFSCLLIKLNLSHTFSMFRLIFHTCYQNS